MRRRDERGASLVLVLALIAFLAVMVPAVLGLVTTGSKVSQPVLEDRRALYAANSALDAAIQQGRINDDVGRAGAVCPEQTLEVDGMAVTVNCEAGTRWCDLDRTVSYTAVVRDPGPPSTVLGTATADVVFRFSLASEPPVEVRQWDSGADAPATTTTLAPCDTDPTLPPESTTTLPPESTTTTSAPTTTVPVVGSYAQWTTTPLTGVNMPGNKWRAEGEVAITDQDGEALVGASVTVQVFRTTSTDADPPWTLVDTIVATTTETGTVTFHSGTFNNPVKGIRFTVAAVAADGLVWNSAAHPDSSEVRRS